MQMEVKTSRVNYSPNSLGDNLPAPASEEEGAFVHYPERVQGHKVRERSPSFADHFSQATLFWNSLSDVEREHIVEAAHFELGKAKDKNVQQRMLEAFNHVDHEFAQRVAQGIGMSAPVATPTPNHGKKSAALSQANTTKTVKGRKVAILAAHGVSAAQLLAMQQALKAMGIGTDVVSQFGGSIQSVEGQEVEVSQTFSTCASVMFDAVYIPGGKKSVEALKLNPKALEFVQEAFRHYKPISASCDGINLLSQSGIQGFANIQANGKIQNDLGVVITNQEANMKEFSDTFVDALNEHRYWTRFQKELVTSG